MKKPLESLPNMRPITLGQITERAKIERKHKPTMKDMAEALGKRIRYRVLPNGKREPYIPLRQNDGHGKVTKDGHVMRELMMPWAKADTERVARDRGDPGAYAGRGKGHCVMRTFGSKLYRQVQGQWVPV